VIPSFIELPIFTRRWLQLGLTDDDRLELEALIGGNPMSAPVVPGTGGVRKLRFAPPSMRRGKSGATRVIYLFVDRRGWVFLLTIYDKTRKDNLTQQEVQSIRKAVDAIKAEFGF